jgi:hypothetical protein
MSGRIRFRRSACLARLFEPGIYAEFGFSPLTRGIAFDAA